VPDHILDGNADLRGPAGAVWHSDDWTRNSLWMFALTQAMPLAEINNAFELRRIQSRRGDVLNLFH
jgi:hypothetical protein